VHRRSLIRATRMSHVLSDKLSGIDFFPSAKPRGGRLPL
jgi:hypothetical protein